jgi:uncharacterized membrane protein
MKKVTVIFCFIFFILSQNVFADAMKININIDLNKNENIYRDSISVNYISENGYNVIFSNFNEENQEILIPVGKYELDFIDFPEGKDLGLEVKAPEKFEVKNNNLELNFEVVNKNKKNVKDSKEKEVGGNKKTKGFKFDYFSIILLIFLFIALYFVRSKSKINTNN